MNYSRGDRHMGTRRSHNKVASVVGVRVPKPGRSQRDPDRITGVLKLLGKVWRRAPDLRLGQLIDCAYSLSGAECGLFNVEEPQIEVGLRKLGAFPVVKPKVDQP